MARGELQGTRQGGPFGGPEWPDKESPPNQRGVVQAERKPGPMLKLSSFAAIGVALAALLIL